MKLFYIYIHDSGVYQKSNVNLGGQFIFRYHHQTRSLDWERNEFYIADFFNIVENDENDYATIKSVSAIIGENGTGKTTFLEFIKTFLVKGGAGFKATGIVGFEDYETGLITIYISEDILISNDSLLKLENNNFVIEQVTDKIIPFHSKLRDRINITQYKSLPDEEDIDYIFFSNIFDKRQEFEFQGLYNISTNFLLKQDWQSKTDRNRRTPNSQIIEEHRFNEIFRELSFINAFKGEYQRYLNFNLPQDVSIQVINHPYNDSTKEDGYTFEYQRIFENYKVTVLNEKRLNRSEIFLLHISTASLSNFFYEYFEYSQFVPYDFNYQEPFEKFIQNDFRGTFAKYLDYLLHLMQDNFKNYYNQLFAIKQLIIILQEYLNTNEKSIVEGEVLNFNISTPKNEELFFLFYDAYKKTYSIDSYLNFNWSDLSTGQKALLNIYSRLFYLSDDEISKRGENLVLGKNLNILLDECELYLHPTWQKEILYQLLNVLPIIFKSSNGTKRNIQIIFTSNSPLLISDIPASNVVFLSQELIDGKKVVNIKDSLNDQHQTFASNIHTLLSDSFFMKEGLMGNVAALKINEIIRDLRKNSKIDRNRADEIRKTIHQIGEPVLKHKLMQMYNDRFNMDIHNRLDVIERRLNINPHD